jgi:hypothetical protein
MNDQEYLMKYRLTKKVRDLFDQLEQSMESDKDDWERRFNDQVNEMVNQSMKDPNAHYKRLVDHEPISVMQEWLTVPQREGFYLGNAIKYIARYNSEGKKGGIRNIEKAIDYLEWLVELDAQC